MSLALPWEVIERTISHCSDSVATLYSFTLTCRDLNPRSIILLLARVKFKNRAQIFSLCDLRAKPHLQPAVRSIIVPPNEFSPHPPIRMLRNLSDIKFSTDSNFRNLILNPWHFFSDPRVPTCNSSVLNYCRVFEDNIQSLSLHGLSFPSLSAFSRFLLVFQRIQSLSCSELEIINSRVVQGLWRERLSQRL